MEGSDDVPGLLSIPNAPTITMASLELEPVLSPSQYMLPDSEDLTNKVIAWATDIAGYAAQLPSMRERDDYLRERHRELVTGAQTEGATERDAAIVADACVDAARRIMIELLALRAGPPQGRA
jgi:hypothetical protein